jgi:hypothetical protein
VFAADWVHVSTGPEQVVSEFPSRLPAWIVKLGAVKLFEGGFSPDVVLMHPRHQAAQKSLAELIAQLRACANVQDGWTGRVSKNASLDGQCAVSCCIIPAASMTPQCSISAPLSTRK